MMQNPSSQRMLKFIRGKGHHPNAERLKIQKELFGFQKEIRHGFPNKPTALAYDTKLKLLAISTKLGGIRIYGQPGVEFYGEHDGEIPITQMIFLPGQARLVTLTEDNFLHLWEINGSKLAEVKSTNLEGRLKKVSVLCLDESEQVVLLGTEGGNIYQLNLSKFRIDENIIYQDIVMKGAPDDFKVNPGAVEALLVKPNDDTKILIGYARGLVVLWDRTNSLPLQTFVSAQQLESLAWRNDASQFISAHNDGSFVVWSTQGNVVEPLEPPNTPYGPYPCKSINKILWEHDNGNSWTIFSGGMPRASYGDKCTVSMLKGEDKHVVFDVTSKIIDFLVINELNAPKSLVILAEEELIVVDMTNDAWLAHALPYLNPIHASAVTCITHASNVNNEVMETLRNLNQDETGSNWPIDGGNVNEKSQFDYANDIVVSGHEDGSVKIWACRTGLALSHLVTIKTNKFFEGDDLDEPPPEEDDDEEWPPFKKIGHYDPYSDDPRLAVKKVNFSPKSGRLIIGGTAGQVIVCDIIRPNTNEESGPDSKSLKVVKSDLVTEKEGFTWKGHQPLTVRSGEIVKPSAVNFGYEPSFILQISPPASLNSLSACDDWDVLAAGTAHGLVIMDCAAKVVVHAKCTLNAQDIANADDNPMSRRKSLKKSLRESFRRLRKGRSQRNIDKKRPGAPTAPSTTDPIKREIRSESPESRPVERQIEARSGSEDGLGSMVRCLSFARTYIANPHEMSHTLWAGTNSGQILVFLLHVPKSEERKSNKKKVESMLGKEIQLKHKAPVIAIEIIDSNGIPVRSGKENEAQVPHKVLIASEEQFKTFLLPTLKPSGKYKLTAHEGSRIRRIGFTTFTSKANKETKENCLTCLTNQGDLTIHSLPELRRQASSNCIKKEDVIAISTLVFTPKGEALYMCSSSELQRVSLAAAHIITPSGQVNVDPKYREPEKKSEEPKTKSAKPGDRKAEENKSSDPHNDTTTSATSEISADITLDSIKDHTVSQANETITSGDGGAVALSTVIEKTEQISPENGEGTTTTTTTSSSSKTKVIKSSTVVMSSSSSVVAQEEKKVLSNGGESEVNGITEVLETSTITEETQGNNAAAPLASMESTGSEFPSIVSTST